jgi:DNA-binding Lrp family transcriptional regulator
MPDDLDRALIVATQAGLPLVERPYHAIGEQLGISAAEVQERLRRMLDSGVIRRIGAVPNHYALGYVHNGMTVWNVDDRQVDELGPAVGRLACVSHCYRRPRRLPEWPYNLFAMVHGRSRDEVDAAVAAIATVLGGACGGHDVLFSSRVLKKTGLRIAA